MTPNVQKAVQFYTERAADYKWFDVGVLPEHREFSHEEIVNKAMLPLPFDKCAIAGIDFDGFVFAVLVTQDSQCAEGEYKDARLLEATVQLAGINGKKREFPAFWIRPSLDTSGEVDMEFAFVDSKVNDNDALTASRLSATIVALLMEIIHKPDAEYKMYTATAKTNNAKRIRQGKKPMFDWHTVLIEPSRQKMPDQGGTHASPRLHDVRGHWVNRNGKRYWRKAHQRGDASLGVVFHDYKLKEKQDGLGR